MTILRRRSEAAEELSIDLDSLTLLLLLRFASVSAPADAGRLVCSESLVVAAPPLSVRRWHCVFGG